MAEFVGGTNCGLLRLSRGKYSDYSVSRWRAKKLIGQVFAMWERNTSHTLNNGWAGTRLTNRAEIDGYQVRVFDHYVKIGCQEFTRGQLERICRHYGWHGY